VEAPGPIVKEDVELGEHRRRLAEQGLVLVKHCVVDQV
jgi:hypothetical protein